jgi:hypothetical protein
MPRQAPATQTMLSIPAWEEAWSAAEQGGADVDGSHLLSEASGQTCGCVMFPSLQQHTNGPGHLPHLPIRQMLHALPDSASLAGPPPCAHPLPSQHHTALHETALVIYPPPPAPSSTPLSPSSLPAPVAAASPALDPHHTGAHESFLVLYSSDEAAAQTINPAPAAATFLCLAPAPAPDAPAALAPDGTMHVPLPAPAPASRPAPAATWSIRRSAPEHGSLLLAGQQCWFIGSGPAGAGQRPPDLLAPDAGTSSPAW